MCIMPAARRLLRVPQGVRSCAARRASSLCGSEMVLFVCVCLRAMRCGASVDARGRAWRPQGFGVVQPSEKKAAEAAVEAAMAEKKAAEAAEAEEEAAAALKKEEAAALKKAVAEAEAAEAAAAKKENEAAAAEGTAVAAAADAAARESAEAVRSPLCAKHVCAKALRVRGAVRRGRWWRRQPTVCSGCTETAPASHFAALVLCCALNVARCAPVLHFARGIGPVCEVARCAFMLHWYRP
jgi:hypothetical protein